MVVHDNGIEEVGGSIPPGSDPKEEDTNWQNDCRKLSARFL
jgi:hypothetical protein